MSTPYPAVGRCLAAIAASVLLLLPAARAEAETKSTEALVEARRNDAKRHFEVGVNHYRAERYAEAVGAFLKADQLAPSAVLSYNIARAYERMNDTAGALRWFRDYLRRSPAATNAGEVKGRIAVLSSELARTGLQQLTILSTPSGAAVLVDGRAVGTTPFTAELTPGTHQVLLDLQGYRKNSSEVVLAASVPAELNLALQEEPAPGRATVARAGRLELPLQVDHPTGPRRFGIVPWVVAGTGVVGLGGALGFELARRADEQQARDAPDQLAFQRELTQVERNRTRARVLAGVGGGLLFTGGVMMLFNDRTQAGTRVGLGCTPRGCTASAKGTF